FAIGFGPAIFKKQGKKTKYSVRIFPIGGFCALEGEDSDSDDPSAFCNQSAWKRLIVIIAGAFFNIVLGFIIVMIILSSQNVFAGTEISAFGEGAVSCEHGLKVGDTIMGVDGRRIYTTHDLSYAFSGIDSDGEVDLLVKRNGKKVLLEDVKFDVDSENDINYIKVDFFVNPIEKTPLNFISQSFKTTVSYGRIVWFSLVDLITGKYGISAVSGPVGVTAAIGEVVKTGVNNLLQIFALITINLGLFNLLPIPALDGSRAMFLLIELIFRKPVPQKYEAAVHAVGMLVLLGFMVLITIKDVYFLFI
ncbi:MAG: site-2 protease family protein, partial [bacterium]|nr:site-2 protease family protein [bacterium]